MLLSRRVGVVVAVADAEDAPAADAPDVDVLAADAPAADAPCQAACQPLVTQDVVLAATCSAIQIHATSGYEPGRY